MQKLEEELGSQLGDDDFIEDEAPRLFQACNISNSSFHALDGELEKGPYKSTIIVKGPSKANGSTVHKSPEHRMEKVNSEEQVTVM